MPISKGEERLSGSPGPQDVPTGGGQLTYETGRDATSAGSLQWSLLSTRAAGVRDEARLIGRDAEEFHREVQDYDLSDRASIKSRDGVEALIDELSRIRGLGWNDIASGVGVSLSAVRKWRRGGVCSPENRMALARLAAIIDLADEAMVVDPAGWLLTPVLDGYSLRHLDLIAADRADLVLDCAFHRKLPTIVLDEFDPEWRERYRRRFEVVTDGDGVRSLSRRT